MTRKQFEGLIAVFNRVVTAPVEEEYDPLTGEVIELVDISPEDWEIFEALINHRYKETVQIGTFKYSRERLGKVTRYHNEEHTVIKWFKDEETLYAIHMALEYFGVLDIYKKIKYEELFKDWYEEEQKNGVDKD